MYLSKIFKNFDKRDLEEQNLKTVILLNPENEEAIFNLAKLTETSDYKKVKNLMIGYGIFAKNFVIKVKISKEIENLSKNKCNFITIGNNFNY